MHVFIPSKGRTRPKTAKLLEEAGVPYTLFVEPQELESYRQQNNGGVIALEKDDMGVSYARQSILNYAADTGIEWFWMLDDDITGLYSYSESEGKLVKDNAEKVLAAALNEAESTPGLVIAGLDFRQFAWSHKGKDLFNTHVCACVLINAQVGWFLKYPKHLMEDKAICLDAVCAGYKTVRYTKWAFATPAMGSGEGGCQSISNRDSEMKQAVEGLLKKFGPDIITPVFKEKLGWWDCRINWKAVRG